MINIIQDQDYFIVPFIEQNDFPGNTGNTFVSLEFFYNNISVLSLNEFDVELVNEKYLVVETNTDEIPTGNGTYKITTASGQIITGTWVKKEITTEPNFITITYGDR